LIVALLLSFLSQPLWADVSATLTQSTIYDGDTVTLIIETTDRSHNGEPDFSVLQQDFEILGTRNSQQTQIINGQRTDKRQWHVELAPKNTGTVTVPAISVGVDTTRPLQLSVKDQPAAVASGTGQPVFLKAQLEPADASIFVQQQILFTLRLFYRESLAEGGFDGLEMDHALIERLGDDKQYKTTISGEQYQVLERSFAIFPEQSGELLIPAIVFNGRMAGEPVRRGRLSGMGSMMDRLLGQGMLRSPGKRIRLRSDAISLHVKPRPPSYSGAHWLPSEQLVLADSWATGPPEFRTGEPVTRTITLEAKGLESSHLPDIKLPTTAGTRLYPEKPEHETHTDGEWVYGSSKQTVAYVPTATGRLTLPEIRLDWWDTSAQQQRTAVLPAWEVNVLAGAEGLAEALPEAVAGINVLDAIEVSDESKNSQQGSTGYFRGFLLASLILLLLILTGFVWQRRSVRAGGNKTGKPAISSRKKLKDAAAVLEKACKDNEAQVAARALLQWAAVNWPDETPRNLGAVACRLVNGKEEIRSLERALYAADAENWQGDALWKVFSEGLESVIIESSVRQEGLSPLYPDWKA